MHLTRSFSPDQFHRALESWQWLGIAYKSPIFISPFGDVFFRSDDGFWLLDTLEATLTRPWTGADELRAALGTTDGQDRFLLAGLAASAERQGIIPAAAQVHGFKIVPTPGRRWWSRYSHLYPKLPSTSAELRSDVITGSLGFRGVALWSHHRRAPAGQLE